MSRACLLFCWSVITIVSLASYKPKHSLKLVSLWAWVWMRAWERVCVYGALGWAGLVL